MSVAQEQGLFPIRICMGYCTYKKAKIRFFTLQPIHFLQPLLCLIPVSTVQTLLPLCSVYHGYFQISANVLSHNFSEAFHESVSRSRQLPAFPSDYRRYPRMRITCSLSALRSPLSNRFPSGFGFIHSAVHHDFVLNFICPGNF